jgi:hypothetical protein
MTDHLARKRRRRSTPCEGIALGPAPGQGAGMTSITRSAVISAPADVVWQTIAHQFDRIGEWATVIPSSGPSARRPDDLEAPVCGRVCHTGIRLAPEVEERITTYDETGRTLAYEAVRRPPFLKSARSRWHVDPIDAHHSRLTIAATIEVGGAVGWAMYLALRLQLARTVPQFLQDLDQYVREHGVSPRKRRQLDKLEQRRRSR